MTEKLTFAQLVSKFSRTGQFIITFTVASQLNTLHIFIFPHSDPNLCPVPQIIVEIFILRLFMLSPLPTLRVQRVITPKPSTPPTADLQSLVIYSLDNWSVMNWRRFGRKCSWSNRGILLAFTWMDRRKPRKTSETILSILAEHRKGLLLTTSNKFYYFRATSFVPTSQPSILNCVFLGSVYFCVI